jgi:5-methyltetrahydrofolate--homocysteine methyltransferase
MSDTGFDETPDVTSSLLKEFAQSGFVNIAGGCCGTTPEHIKAIAETVRRARGPNTARSCRSASRRRRTAMKLSGLEPFTIDETVQRRCSSTSASAPT